MHTIYKRKTEEKVRFELLIIMLLTVLVFWDMAESKKILEHLSAMKALNFTRLMGPILKNLFRGLQIAARNQHKGFHTSCMMTQMFARLLTSSSSPKGLRASWATDSNASCGQSTNQSMVQQLTKDGNILHRLLHINII